MSYNTKNYASQGGSIWNVGGILKIHGADIAAPVKGNCYYVDSVNGDDGNDGTSWDESVATLDYAIGLCTANNGDRIYLAPGHAETLTGASDITIDIAGLEIVGVGVGNDRAKFTFGTDVGASIVISAASVKLINIVGIAGLDALTNPIHIQAADCCIDMEWRDGSASIEAVRAILGTSAADRLKINLKYLGYTGGSGATNAIKLVGTDNAEINLWVYGQFTTAIVEFHTTLCSNIKINGYVYNQGSSNFTLIVVDTAGSSTWSFDGFDGEACVNCSGGQDAAIAADDSSGITSTVNSYTKVENEVGESYTKVTGDEIKDENQSYILVNELQGESYCKVENDAGRSYTLLEHGITQSYVKVETDSILDEINSYTLVVTDEIKDENQSYILVNELQGESYCKVESDASRSYILLEHGITQSYIKVETDSILDVVNSYIKVETDSVLDIVNSYIKVEADIILDENQSYMLVLHDIVMSFIQVIDDQVS